MRLGWTRIAIRDLIHARRYIAQDNPQAARSVAQHILEAAELLLKHPEMGRAGRVRGTRELVIAQTLHLIVYRVRGKRVHVVRILHGRQLWP
jgi:toxin ParE1/3/4